MTGGHDHLPSGKQEHTRYSQHLPGTEANPGNTPDHHPDDPSMPPPGGLDFTGAGKLRRPSPDPGGQRPGHRHGDPPGSDSGPSS